MQFAANLSLMFQEWPLLDRFAAAREAGFEAVEVQFPYVEPVERLSRARAAAGCQVVLINAPVTPAHPAGVAARPELQAQVRASLAQVLEYAEALGVAQVNVLAGCAAPEERERCRAVLAENLAALAAALAPQGVMPLLEALNPADVPGCLVDDLDVARDILQRCGGGVGLLFDIYHVAMTARAPQAALAEVFDHVRHVQFADAPGRHEPGTGAAAIEPTLELLQSRGYPGWVSAEYRPSASTAASLAWLPAWRERFAA